MRQTIGSSITRAAIWMVVGAMQSEEGHGSQKATVEETSAILTCMLFVALESGYGMDSRGT